MRPHGRVGVGGWGSRCWLGVGLVVGVGLQNKALLIFPVVALVLVGPRKIFATKYFPMAVGLTIVIWLPYLLWQWRNGWPRFVHRIAEVRATLGPDVAILTDNYGEAGAIERFGGEYGLPTPHSGHNSYWWWGPPSDTASAVIVRRRRS
ncbi:hypothetical protein OG563_09830 [Nocardia vinacea]|uniref:Glycosyltransferase RgtA/B/C/D-like domain-containing protein n=1 Tax=Nocardia vinacea TaxID=96468 RepID=A0ABZ1YYY9_9NOCA|nr:hypothetical protein [Nocardia vinacea]